MFQVRTKIFAFWVFGWDPKLCWKFRQTAEKAKKEDWAYDAWALIDWQHGCWSDEEIHQFCMFADPGKVMIRIPQNLPHFISSAIQFGAQGLMVPQINNLTEAKDIIKSAYVYPLGERSIGGREWFCNRFGQVPWPEYLKTVNNNLLILAQIEHWKASRNIANIMQLQGIDGLFLGAGDLTITDGKYGRSNETGVPWDQPSAWRAAKIIGKAAWDNKKIWGTLTNPQIQQKRDEELSKAQFLVVNDLATAVNMAVA